MEEKYQLERFEDSSIHKYTGFKLHKNRIDFTKPVKEMIDSWGHVELHISKEKNIVVIKETKEQGKGSFPIRHQKSGNAYVLASLPLAKGRYHYEGEYGGGYIFKIETTV